jgi:hypothetical protein
LVPTSLAASIPLESPKRGTRAAGTSEKEVRFGISLCAATPPTSAGRRAPDTPAAENPARLSIRFVSLARTALVARIRWARRQPSAVLQRTHHHHELQANFICCTPLLSTDADLIAESICLISGYEVRRERSVLAIKACNEGSKPQDIPSDHKTRQGASADARYDTSNAGVLAR